MKILLDFGHPKYVHALKNPIAELRARGHEFLVLARDKECIQELCRRLDIPFHDRGRGGRGVVGRLTDTLATVRRFRSLVGEFRPDLLASFGSPTLAVIGMLRRLPVVVFDDHEPNRAVQALYRPASAAIVVPSCFQKDFGHKQLRFNGYFELAYLHPDRFQPDAGVVGRLGLKPAERFTLLRFVAWQALHDRGQHGLGLGAKRRLVERVARQARVFISSEAELPDDLEPLRFPLPADCLHHALAHASLYAGDSTTMAAEAAVLGVPALHLSDIQTGYLQELQDKYQLLESFPPTSHGLEAMLRRAGKLLDDPQAIAGWQEKRRRMLADKIDVAAFITRFLEQGLAEELGRVVSR